jgi:hypothetical protein
MIPFDSFIDNSPFTTVKVFDRKMGKVEVKGEGVIVLGSLWWIGIEFVID